MIELRPYLSSCVLCEERTACADRPKWIFSGSGVGVVIKQEVYSMAAAAS